MRATLEFLLPDESEEHQHACMAGQYYAALCEIDNVFRRYEKYGPDEPGCQPPTRQSVRDAMERYGVVLP